MSSSDRSSRPAITKINGINGKKLRASYIELTAREKKKQDRRLDKSDKCRAKRTGIEISD